MRICLLQGSELLCAYGIIASRNVGSHIALFFVDGNYHRRGIGRKLFDTMLESSTADIITVHSSIYACNVYEKLRFQQTGNKVEEAGITYIPMEYMHFLDLLQDKNDEVAYTTAKRIAAESEFISHHTAWLIALLPSFNTFSWTWQRSGHFLPDSHPNSGLDDRFQV